MCSLPFRDPSKPQIDRGHIICEPDAIVSAEELKSVPIRVLRINTQNNGLAVPLSNAFGGIGVQPQIYINRMPLGSSDTPAIVGHTQNRDGFTPKASL